jgi:hypothetical protein
MSCMKIGFFVFGLASVCWSCNVARRIPGNYSTRLASQGFFATYLDLHTESSFFYQFSGDLIRNNGIGTYSVNKRRIELTYLPSKYDTLWLGVREDTVWSPDRKFIRIDTVGIPLKVLDTAMVESRPTRFYYKSNRLFYVNKEGNVHEGKGFVYSPRRKFLIFGTHYFNRRNPLRRNKRTRDIA